MANKILELDHPAVGLANCYIEVRHHTNSTFLTSLTTAAFSALPVTFPVVTEDPDRPGVYQATISGALTDGPYPWRMFQRVGAAQDRAVDMLLGSGELVVRNDAEATIQNILDALLNVGGLTGTHVVTVQTYLTATTTPIADVLIDVYNSTETTRLNGSQLKTTALGQMSFLRDNGTYKIRLMKAGVTFATGTVVVNNTDVSVILYGTAVAADAPPTAPAIRVYEFCFMPDGVTPMASTAIRAKAKIIGLPYDYNGRYHSGQEIDGTYNAATGKVYWELAPGASVDFFIRDFHSQHVTKTVPLTDPDNEIRLEDMP